MAQVSIQYLLEKRVDKRGVIEIKQKLDEYPGVKSVSINDDHNVVCIDYDDTGISQTQLEEALNAHGFAHTLLDKIIF